MHAATSTRTNPTVNLSLSIIFAPKTSLYTTVYSRMFTFTLSLDFIAGGFTIFAPSDLAFSLLPRSAVLQLQNNTDKLREVVLFHVVPGELRLNDLADNDMLDSASPRGRKLRVNVYQHGAENQVRVCVYIFLLPVIVFSWTQYSMPFT